MFKKRPFFITFEGIEGSGKSYQSYKLFQKLKKENIPVIHTREPGGTLGAEKIRKIILTDYFKSKKKEEFNKYTDTLLYLAARNEHIQNKIKPALKRNNVMSCLLWWGQPRRSVRELPMCARNASRASGYQNECRAAIPWLKWCWASIFPVAVKSTFPKLDCKPKA